MCVTLTMIYHMFSHILYTNSLQMMGSAGQLEKINAKPAAATKTAAKKPESKRKNARQSGSQRHEQRGPFFAGAADLTGQDCSSAVPLQPPRLRRNRLWPDAGHTAIMGSSASRRARCISFPSPPEFRSWRRVPQFRSCRAPGNLVNSHTPTFNPRKRT